MDWLVKSLARLVAEEACQAFLTAACPVSRTIQTLGADYSSPTASEAKHISGIRAVAMKLRQLLLISSTTNACDLHSKRNDNNIS